MFVHTPQERNTYASVLFLHGWKSLPQTYDTILQHLASHGFVVIVPQLVSDCTEFVLGDPTLEEQAGRAAAVIDWAQLRLSDVLGMEVNTRRMGLAGHSLGGKVAWLLMQRDDRLLAVAAIDPVDVTAIPLGNDDAVTADLAPLAVPGFVIGAGIRGACSFEGANHWDFFNTLASPAWHMVATDYGHQDMLDERDGALARRVCGSGPDRDGMRRLVGGALAAFFRGELQYEDDAHRYLSDSTITPVAVELDAR
jgi:chlorophyllase